MLTVYTLTFLQLVNGDIETNVLIPTHKRLLSLKKSEKSPLSKTPLDATSVNTISNSVADIRSHRNRMSQSNGKTQNVGYLYSFDM